MYIQKTEKILEKLLHPVVYFVYFLSNFGSWKGHEIVYFVVKNSENVFALAFKGSNNGIFTIYSAALNGAVRVCRVGVCLPIVWVYRESEPTDVGSPQCMCIVEAGFHLNIVQLMGGRPGAKIASSSRCDL